MKPKTWWENICEVFTGDHREGFSWRWLFPIDIEHDLCLENEYR